MTQYFACTRGCTGCCPGGSYDPQLNYISEGDTIPVATIGDLYRSFVHTNPHQSPFSEFIDKHFRFAACCSFPDPDNPSDEEGCLIEKIQEYDLVLLNAPEIKGFSVLPVAKNPCVHLEESGCSAHGTVTKYITCAIHPEGLLLPENQNYINSEGGIFPCIQCKSLKPEQYQRVRDLSVIRDREMTISNYIFPCVSIDEWDGEGEGTMKLNELIDGGIENIIHIINRKMKSFDDSTCREWEDEIKELTGRYGEIIRT